MTQWRPQELVNDAARIVRAGPICDSCLGRAFGKLGHGMSNRERGRDLTSLLSTMGVERKQGECWLCAGLFESIPDWADRCASLTEDVEFESYLFGARLSPRLDAMEEFFDERFHTGHAESLKHAFNREMGKAFEARMARGTLDTRTPHLTFVIDLPTNSIELRILPLYIYGRYRKLIRGIPQTHWPCRSCKGKGCETCHFTGKQYPESVEELVSGSLIEEARAASSHLHGAGREDVDARMLGSGRPFVLELLSPRRRSLNLSHMTDIVNRSAVDKVEVCSLRYVDAKMVALVKETSAEKAYRARVSFEAEIGANSLMEALNELVGQVSQRTPQRVAHRRADLVRNRRLIEATGRLLSPREAELEFLGEGGLYIKELVSGDDGRTQPSLTGLLGVLSVVDRLDVVSVSSPVFPDEEDGNGNAGHRFVKS